MNSWWLLQTPNNTQRRPNSRSSLTIFNLLCAVCFRPPNEQLGAPCRMIAAFGSGTAFSLVSGMAGPQPLMGAFSTGVVFALLQGGLFKVAPCQL